MEGAAYRSAACLPPCRHESFDVATREFGTAFTGDTTLLFFIYATTDVAIVEEYVVMDFGAIVSSLGGSLGLLLGFSFFDGFILLRKAARSMPIIWRN